MDLSIRPTDVDCLIRMNSNYFLSQGVPVLGGIFNRGDLDGFYHYASCGEHITRFFAMNRGRESVFGVIPEVPALNGLREKVGMMMLAGESKDGGAPRGEAAAEDGRQQLLALAEENISNVAAHVDVEGLVLSAACDAWNRQSGEQLLEALLQGHDGCRTDPSPLPLFGESRMAAVGGGASTGSVMSRKRTRAAVEAEASKKGAKGG